MQHLNETFVSCQKGVMSLLGKIFPPPPLRTHQHIFGLHHRSWWTMSDYGIWGTVETSNNMCLWNDQLSIISTQLTSPWLLNVAAVCITVLISSMTTLWFFVFSWMLLANPTGWLPFPSPTANIQHLTTLSAVSQPQCQVLRLSRNPAICFLRRLRAVRHPYLLCTQHSSVIIIIIVVPPLLMEKSLHPLTCR